MGFLRVAVAAAVLAAAEAGQVHLAYGPTNSKLSVAWATTSGSGTSRVEYGLSPNSLKNVTTGDAVEFKVDHGRKWYTRTAMMEGLKPGVEYYYRVGDEVNGYSEVFRVTNRRDRSARGEPYRHILFGDMGARAAFTLCKACTLGSRVCTKETCKKNTTVGLVSEIDTADMFLHVGDFAYDMGSDDGKVGDAFMENIEQVAAYVPYMVSHGNHEDSDSSLAHYIETFRSQPSNAVPPTFKSKNGVSTNTLYFSWDYGLVHYVSISTELFHFPVSGYDKDVTEKTMLAWLEKDLEAANRNRKAFPWIVVHGHRPLYSSSHTGADMTVRKALEPLFFKYGVDFSVNGHQHNYERSWPVHQDHTDHSYNDPRATIYIVTGAAGSQELHTPFTSKQPAWSSFRSNTFGYTRFLAYNASHIRMQQVQTDPTDFPGADYGRVIDDVWIVQNNHGPFNPSLAPRIPPEGGCPPHLCGSHDHFAPLLNLKPSYPGEPLYSRIATYRKVHGDLAWARKLNSVLAKINTVQNATDAKGLWEDGLLDEKEQAAFQWIDRHNEQ